ncbi:MAG: PilZ domain-containing protein [Deltaproteobacteria bacterium]|nr:PilZ domain-containing protein [Deltaproteobacteria bacterium]
MKLRDDRTEITILANIADGKHVFEGMVVNVSREGLKMIDIPQKFDFYSEKYTAVITEKDNNFKLHLKPRWAKTKKTHKDVGFKIISPPLEWIKFINELEGREIAASPVYY